MMLSRSFEEKRFIHVETIDLIGFCISFGVFFNARMCIIMSQSYSHIPIWEYHLSKYKAVFASSKCDFASDQENPLQSFS